MEKQSAVTAILKILIYGTLIISSLYFISYLNIFPEAVSYQKEDQIIEIKRGAIDKTSYIFVESELELNEQLRLALLREDISILQNLLVFIAFVLPFGFFLIIEQRKIQLFKFSKILKMLLILLMLMGISIFLTFAYIQKVNEIDEILTPLILEET